VCSLKAKHANASQEDKFAVQARQGRAPFGVDLRIVDTAGSELPWDGKAFGDLHVRGRGSPVPTSRAKAAIR